MSEEMPAASGETPVPPKPNQTQPVETQAPRARAADLVHRFLGQDRLRAEGTVRECDDAEVARIVAAGGDRHGLARDQIKRVLAGAYDRRREAARREAAAFEADVRQARAAEATGSEPPSETPATPLQGVPPSETPAAVIPIETPATLTTNH